MIQLTRIRTRQAIRRGLRGKFRINKNKKLIQGKLAGNLVFKSNYWKPAKEQLKQETHGKCAYCEAEIGVVAYGDVEHFRPKSRYWWLAYCYDNYLYACQICNQQYKSDDFPIHGTPLTEPTAHPGMTPTGIAALAADLAPDPLDIAAVQAFLDLAEKEDPGLLNPYVEDPEPLFKWEASDDILREVTLEPRGNSLKARRAADAAKEYYGINREELCYARWEVYEDLSIFKETFLDPDTNTSLRQRTRNRIVRMIEDSAPFAGMVRYFVKTVWHLSL